MITGGNAFDVFPPEKVKEETIKHPFREAPRMQDNFTRLNFGWLGYRLPAEKSIGTQPDQLEFVTSKAAAWDCPVSVSGNLNTLEKHPRTADNFEVFRRWEEVRAKKWLTEEQKKMLRNPDQEFILLLNEKNEPELVPYDKILNVANGSQDVIAFTFERNRELYAVYWHISGDKKLELPVKSSDITVMESLGREISPGTNGNNIVIPAGNRRYIKTGILSKETLVKAFADARIVD
jgi:hypothetical protein